MRCPVIVGRESEWGDLRAALAMARSGRGSAIGVFGPPGIGKSRLVGDFTAAARDDAVVLVGRCVEDGSPPALRPLTEALLSGLRVMEIPTGPDLAPFLPALSSVVPLWPTVARPVDRSPIVVAEGVLRLVSSVAGRTPAILVLEDLQWADPDTLAVVEYLADNVATTGLLVVITARDAPGAAHALRRRLTARGVLRDLALPALNDEDTQLMAAGCLGHSPSPELNDLVRSRAEGVPLLIEELVATDPASPHADVVPSTVAEVTSAKLSSLDPCSQAVIEAAAVLGARFGWDMLTAVVDHDPTAVISALREAVDAGLIHEVPGGGFGFRHALTRDAVLATMLRPQRAAVARRAWEALKPGGGDHDGTWCASAAEFAVLAGKDEAAVALLQSGARVDLDRGSLATAEAALRRAAALETTTSQIIETNELLAEVLVRAGRPVEAAAVTTTLLEQHGGIQRRSARMAPVRLRLAKAWAAAGRWTDAARESAAARAASTDPAVDREIDLMDAVVAFGHEEFERSERLARAVHRSTERTGPHELACEALELLGRLARRHDLTAAADMFGLALDTAELHDLPVWRLRALHELSTIDLLWSLDVGRAEKAGTEAERRGAVSLVAFSDFHRAVMHCWRDEHDAASALLTNCERLCRSLHLPLLPMVLTMQALVTATTGRRHDSLCEDALAAAGDDPHVHAAVAHVHATRLLLAENRPGALAALDPCMESYRDRLETTSGPPLALWTLLATIERGDDPLHHVSTLPGIRLARWTNGYLGYAEAVSLGRQHRPEAATAAFTAADRTMNHPVPMPHFQHLARRHVAEAAIHDGWGSPHQWLHEDEVYFRDKGHHLLAAACRGLLRRTGKPVPRRTPGPPIPAGLVGSSITGREMEVLQLVAQGLTNREIAQRLTLSTRTVEKHVERLLAKTGTPQRAQLVARAARNEW
nr:LuxR family transcriptional regulator [Pseudonocardia acidicola]